MPFGLLAAKLKAYHIEPPAITLILNYLKDRGYVVKLGNSISDIVYPKIGSPQGSSFGPLLWNISHADLCWFIEDSIGTNFADDISLLSSGKDINLLVENTNQNLEKLVT